MPRIMLRINLSILPRLNAEEVQRDMTFLGGWQETARRCSGRLSHARTKVVSNGVHEDTIVANF